MDTLLGTPLQVIPGSELGAISSYGKTPAPHLFLSSGSLFLLPISSSAFLTSAAKQRNFSTISLSPVHEYASRLSPMHAAGKTRAGRRKFSNSGIAEDGSSRRHHGGRVGDVAAVRGLLSEREAAWLGAGERAIRVVRNRSKQSADVAAAATGGLVGWPRDGFGVPGLEPDPVEAGRRQGVGRRVGLRSRIDRPTSRRRQYGSRKVVSMSSLRRVSCWSFLLHAPGIERGRNAQQISNHHAIASIESQYLLFKDCR
ncbi:uncharacterized protein A4U43_C06F4630 [Asparagus officinalis]|uniref:Uncharacterized protein n=1 Tax=Asparagus officinalis TaxID=4686 RepID=A0A5P1EJJ0_ASPOF|nr:uncharacterized protein A4U43_C06F4630 [Asparagus officinalis]